MRKTIVMAVVALMSCAALSAQERMSEEQRAQAIAERIEAAGTRMAKEFKLKDDAQKTFVETFTAYQKEMFATNQIQGARGREQAEEKKEMTDEEALEAEINRWYDDEASKEFEQVLWADTCNCARHFANWQREQMMKNAVDGKVHESVDPDSVWVVQDGWVSSKERGLVAGDRVKLIIVKEK